MSEKKQPQKYSSLLPPLTSDDDEKSAGKRSSGGKSAQKYESLLSPAESKTSRNEVPSRQPNSMLLAEDDLNAGPSGNGLTSSPSNDPPLYATATGDEPPPYADDAAFVEDDLLGPDTLLLAGTEIHSTVTADSLPLYKLSLAIGHLRESNMKVSISRCDYKVHNASSLSGAAPRIGTRDKHIYDLTRLPDIMMPRFQYHLESTSRSSLGLVGLKTHRGLGGSGYRAWRATRPNKASDLEQSDMLYDIKSKRKGLFEWRDGADKSKLLALETSEMGIYRLEVKETMDRQRRDALVATWCLKIWWEIAVAYHLPITWDEVKRVLQTSNTTALMYI